MKPRGLILVLCSFFVFSFTVDAQIGNLLKKKAGKSVGDKVRGGALSKMLGGGEEVPNKGTYIFDAKIDMDMLAYEDGDVVSVIKYITHVNTSNSDMAIEIRPQEEDGSSQGFITMIYDRENNSMFTLTDNEGQKMAMATSMDDLDDPGTDTGEEVTDMPAYTKMGKTKTISGYKCEGYTMQDGENTVEMWVTDKAPFKIGKKEMQKAGVPMVYGSPFAGAVIMEMDMFENGVKKMTMLVKDINDKSSKKISLEGYTMMNIGGI